MLQKRAYLVAVLFLCLFFSASSTSYGLSDDMVITAWPTSKTYVSGESPTIVGVIKDQTGNRLENVKIEVQFSDQSVSSTTNNVGSFMLKSPQPAKAGQYTVSVIATKDNATAITSAAYTVEDGLVPIPPVDIQQAQQAVESIPKVVESIPTMVNDGITNNPVSQIILQQMEIQKQQQEEQQKFIDEQRRIAKLRLAEDLQRMNKDYESQNPRNVFERFVADMDYTVQQIFLGQFALTEQLTQQAQSSKLEALKNGASQEEATKVFQRKAAVTHKQLVDYNEELNIKYGLADKSTQEKFDEQGKLPRTEN